ncbi:hypothetical protein [Halobacterium salinarum]|uniref:hypothetical protein n=1 Tax=Halobacterium salinarum TaxID=2242 RepID=UPI001F1E8B80|nr:hypothetical protein [Halobacterium salinarum]MCF2165381.1 hypothetical protein [Halobacterium salinarum]MCF2168241.1 hypothetical protein [Halobacterium salinarum]
MEFTVGNDRFIEEHGKYPHRWEGLHGNAHAQTEKTDLEIDRGTFADIHAEVSFSPRGCVNIGGDIQAVQSELSFLVALTPAQAREYAASILDAAERAEAEANHEPTESHHD